MTLFQHSSKKNGKKLHIMQCRTSAAAEAPDN
jgi:hypothetical protein